MTISTILTTGPIAPSRDDPDNFRERADDYVDWKLNTNVIETNTLIGEINSTAADVESDANRAEAFGSAATASVDSTWWVTGTTYGQGAGVVGSNGYTYKSIVAGNIGIDPTTDNGSHWVRISGPFPNTAATTSSAIDITLTTTSAQMQSIAMTAAGKGVTLPDATDLHIGPMFVIFNAGDYAFYIADNDGNLIWQVAPSDSVTAYLFSTSTAAGDWHFTPGELEPFMPLGLFDVDTVAATYQHLVCISGDAALLFYCDADTYLQVVAINTSTGSVIDGPLELNSALSRYVSATRLSDSEAMVVFLSGSNSLQAAVVEYSSSSIALTGGPTELSSTARSTQPIVDTLTDSTVAVVWKNSTDDSSMTNVITWDGTTIAMPASDLIVNTTSSTDFGLNRIDDNNYAITLLDTNMKVYTIDSSGASLVLTDSATLTPDDYMYPSTVQINDDGTSLWFASVFKGTQAQIQIFSINKLTYAITENSLFVGMSETSSETFSIPPSGAVSISDYLIFMEYSDKEGSGRPYGVVCKWDTSTETMTKLGSYELSSHSMYTNSYTSLAVTYTSDLLWTARDATNNNYLTTMPIKVIL